MGKSGLRIVIAAGIVGLSASGWVTLQALRAASAAGPAPLDSTVAAAPDGRWVRLQDAVLHCTSKVEVRGAAVYSGTAVDGRVPFVAQLAADAPCDAKGLDGSFLPGTYAASVLNAKLGLKLPDGPPLRVFTQAFTPRNQRRIAWLALPWLVLSVLLVATGARGLRRLAAAPPPAA